MPLCCPGALVRTALPTRASRAGAREDTSPSFAPRVSGNALSESRHPVIRARHHVPTTSAGGTLEAAQVELVDGSDEEEGGCSNPTAAVPTTTQLWQPDKAVAAAAPAAVAAPPPAASTFVADVRAAKLDVLDDATAGLMLPTDGTALLAAGGLEPYLAECIKLLRCDFTLLATRRLRRVETLLLEVGFAPLSESRDPRVAELLRTEQEFAPVLARMLDHDSWTLANSKREFELCTYVRMGEGGRLDIKVTGLLPQSIAACCAPLLHPDLYSTWLPGVTHSHEVSRISNFRRLVYLRALHVPL